MTGATAAMALPPQMAVPDAMSWDKLLGNLKKRLSNATVKNTNKIVVIVSHNPALLTSNAAVNCNPKPKPIIDHCKAFLEACCAKDRKGLPPIKAMDNPINNAMGALTKGNNARIANKTKTILEIMAQLKILIEEAKVLFVIGFGCNNHYTNKHSYITKQTR